VNAEAFLSERSYSLQTTETYRLILSRFSDWLTSESIPLDKLTAQDFDRLTGKRGWSSAYIYVQQAAIRAYIRWALERGDLGERPPFLNKKAIRRSPSMNLRALSLSEIRQLVDFLMAHRTRKTYRRTLAMMLISYDCGLRASEVCGLTMANLPPEGGRVIVKRKRGGVTVNGFGPLTQNALGVYLADRELVSPNGGHVFLTDEGKPMDRNSWRLICLRLAEAADVEHFSPHALRRGTAISYREQGAPVADVLQRMGWNGPGGMALYQHYSQLFAGDPLEAYTPSAGLTQ